MTILPVSIRNPERMDAGPLIAWNDDSFQPDRW